jgi:hypothetical protein
MNSYSNNSNNSNNNNNSNSNNNNSNNIKQTADLSKQLKQIVFGRKNVAVKMRFNLFLIRSVLSVLAMVVALLGVLSINGAVGYVAELSDGFELLAQRRNEIAGVITLLISGALYTWSQLLPASGK